MSGRARVPSSIIEATDQDAGAIPDAEIKDARLVLGATRRRRGARLPAALYFPLVVVLSLAWTTVGYATIAQWTQDELSTFARSVSRAEGSALVAWRIFELALGWFGDYDSYDLASLSLLSHSPLLFLISAFYQIRPLTAATCLSIDVLSSVVPFALLRPLSAAHAAAPTIPNRVVLVDKPIQLLTTVLASAIYALTISLSYGPFLRSTLLLNFSGIPSIEPSRSRDSTLFTAALAVCLGAAARTFIFVPAAATGRVAQDEAMERFDPVSATLGETVLYNVWGFRAQTKTAIRRTLVAAFVCGARTLLQCRLTIAGVDLEGAVGYSSVWMVASILTGLGLGLVLE